MAACPACGAEPGTVGVCERQLCPTCVHREKVVWPPKVEGEAGVPPGDAVEHDAVNHPAHYTAHKSGVECITVTEHFNFNRGNAIKYIWRAGEKRRELEDLKKAEWYLRREIARLSKESP